VLPETFIYYRTDHADLGDLSEVLANLFSWSIGFAQLRELRDKQSSSLPQHRVLTTITCSDKDVSHWNQRCWFAVSFLLL